MSKLQLRSRWVAVAGLTGALAACSGEATAPNAPTLQIREAAGPQPIGVRPPCDNQLSERFCPLPPSATTAPSVPVGQASLVAANVTTLAASLRVRCEARRYYRAKISVDGNGLSPRNGSFRARVRAAGGITTSVARRAIGDQVEFDFDSNRDDIARGATSIPASFIVARSGPDVIGELLDARGRVVASQGAECRIR